MNMNPQLMELLGIAARNPHEGRYFLNDDQCDYLKAIEALNNADLKDPTKWPWRDQTNGYIKTLRMLVGHFPLVPPVATAVILNDDMQILLERRSDDGNWSIPGGIVGAGESVRECIIHDVDRETGLLATPENLHLFDELSGKAHNYPNGDIIYSVKIIYVVKHCSGELKTNYENLELQYFALSSIPDKVSGSTRKIVASLLDRFDEVSGW